MTTTTPSKTTSDMATGEKATTGTTTTPTKPKAPKKAAKVPAATGPEPRVVTVTDAVVAEADLKKKELIDLVVTRSGIKKKDAKPVVEAMLAVLGESIGSGRELNLQPLGKLRINRSEEKANGRVIVCKLRQSKPQLQGPKDPLAEAAE